MIIIPALWLFTGIQDEPETIQRSKMINGLEAEFQVLRSKKSVKHGTFRSYYENDSLAEKGNYRDNKRVGVWSYYTRDGALMEQYDYDKQVSIFLEPHYDENGKFYFGSKLFQVRILDQMPVFKGGYFQFMHFIERNLRYPQDAIDNKIQGTVIVGFQVGADGKISQVKLSNRLPSVSCNDEAVRLIRSMEDWHPGRENGTAVAIRYFIPISFRLK